MALFVRYDELLADRESSQDRMVLHMHNSYHGPVNYIESLRSDNTFAGTSYGEPGWAIHCTVDTLTRGLGPVLQNTAGDSNVRGIVPLVLT